MIAHAMLEEEPLEADLCELCDSFLDDLLIDDLFPEAEAERDTGPLAASGALDDALEERMTQPLPASRRTVQDPLLTSEQQYCTELAQYTRLPNEQEHALIERARSGDAQAREELITSLLPNISAFAWKYFLTSAWEVAHLDYLDVVQAGNLTLVEKVDRALQTDHVCAYLLTYAYGVIRKQCERYGASLIAKPQMIGIAQVRVVSLDVPLSHETTNTLGDVLAAPDVTPAPMYDCHALYQAIDA